MAERLQIPAYTDRWMMGDRFGDLVKTTGSGEAAVAHVKLDKSGKTIRVALDDCEVVS